MFVCGKVVQYHSQLRHCWALMSLETWASDSFVPFFHCMTMWSELLFIYSLTFHLHAHLQALPETTELAAVAMVFVDHTVLVTAAAVCQTLAHTSLEESLTPFAADRPIMPPFKYTNPHIVYLEIKKKIV